MLDLGDGNSTVLTGQLSLTALPWLADHAVNGTVLLPGAALTELALHAGGELGSARTRRAHLAGPSADTGQRCSHPSGHRRPGDGQRRPISIRTAAPVRSGPSTPPAPLTAGRLHRRRDIALRSPRPQSRSTVRDAYQRWPTRLPVRPGLPRPARRSGRTATTPTPRSPFPPRPEGGAPGSPSTRPSSTPRCIPGPSRPSSNPDHDSAGPAPVSWTGIACTRARPHSAREDLTGHRSRRPGAGPDRHRLRPGTRSSPSAACDCVRSLLSNSPPWRRPATHTCTTSPGIRVSPGEDRWQTSAAGPPSAPPDRGCTVLRRPGGLQTAIAEGGRFRL